MRTYGFTLTDSITRLYTFTRVDGTVIRTTPWDRAITIGADTWTPDELTEFAVSERNDGTPASTQITVYPRSGGLFDPTDVEFGMYDGATLLIEVADAENPLVRDFYFFGTIGQTPVQTVYDEVTFELRNPHANPIRQLVETYTLFCRKNFGDVFCGVDASTYEASCTIDTVINLHNFTLTALPDARASVDGWYNPGRITFTSGLNKGRAFRIGFWTAASLQVTTFLPVGVCARAGDTAIIRPNCDKTLGMCSSKYSNAARHGGFPRYAGAKAAATSDF